MLNTLNNWLRHTSRWQSRHDELLTPSMISLLLAIGGMGSLVMAFAGEAGWLQETPGHYYTLMAAMAVQFVSALLARLLPERAVMLFSFNLALYVVLLGAIVHFNPQQAQILFAAYFPAMAAFLAVSSRLGILLTVLALLLPVMLPELDRTFIVNYAIFMIVGALISYWLSTLLRRMIENLDRLVSRLDHLATHDPLTGALNRRGIKEHGEALLALHKRTVTPMTLALIDLDFFKQVNDTYGHEAGDAALKGVVTALKAAFRRRSDVIGRLGGDELVLILPETPAENACQKLEAFARHLQQHRPTYHEVELPIALSIGVATLRPELHHELGELLHEADTHVYRAKAAGRSHICCPDGTCTAIELGFTPPQYR